MWTVVYMAQSKENIEKLQHILEEKNILVMVRSVNREYENEDGYYELLVPESEVEQTHSIIIDEEL